MVVHEGALMDPRVVLLLQQLEEGNVPFVAPRIMSRLLRIPEERRERWIELQSTMKETRVQRAEKRAKQKVLNRLKRRARR